MPRTFSTQADQDTITNPAGSDTEIQFNDAASFGADSQFVWDNTDKKLGIGTGNPSEKVHISTSGNTNAFKIRDSNGRVAIGTSTFSSVLNIGGDRIVKFQGGNGIIQNTGSSEVLTIRSNGSGGRVDIDAGSQIRIFGDVGGQFNILGQPGSLGTPTMSIRQGVGSSSRIISIQDSSANEVVGLSSSGGFIARPLISSFVKRFTMEHEVSGSSSDGDGVGVNLRTENASGVMTDVAYWDFIYDDISLNQGSSRFFVRDDSGGGSPGQIERMRIQGKDGNVGIGTSTVSGKLHIDQSSPSGAIPVLVLDQDDIDDTFINFIGTSAADGSRSISSDTTEDSAKFGAIRVDINGTTKWIRIYDDES